MKKFLIVPEKIVELLMKDSYIIFVTEVTRFLTPQLSLIFADHIYITH